MHHRFFCLGVAPFVWACCAMGLYVAIYPMFAIKVPPLAAPPVDSFTWRVNPGCKNATSRSNDVQFISQYINLTPYVQGCGSWGDGVETYERRQINGGSTLANLEFANLFPLWSMMAVLIGMPLVMVSVLTYTDLMPTDGARGERPGNRLRWFGVAVLGLYGVCLVMGACFILFESKVYDRTWLCRSYIAHVGAFDEIDWVYVVNASPDRGSSEITSPVIWSQIEAIAERCENLNLHYGSSNSRSFSIAFEASDQVNCEIDSAIWKAWNNLLVYGVCVIGVPLFIGMLFGFVLTPEQKNACGERLCCCVRSRCHPVPSSTSPTRTASPPSAPVVTRVPSWLHPPLTGAPHPQYDSTFVPPYTESSSVVVVVPNN